MYKSRDGISWLSGLIVVLSGVILTLESWAVESIRPAYTPEYVAQMLDYISRDYALAVKDGKVIDNDEYVEQLNLADAALQINDQVKTDQVKAFDSQKDIRAGILSLTDLIKAKATHHAVKNQALKVRNLALMTAGTQMAPKHWPSLAQGKQVFENNCISCHGATGDGRGPAGKALTPKPTNFLDHARMEMLSPLSAFNSVKLGIQNTAMQGFHGLSDDELWAVSFYVLSLRHRSDPQVTTRLEPTIAETWLQTTASLPDSDLMQALPGSPEERHKLLAALRSHPGNIK